MTYKTKGVCASHIEFEVDDNKKVQCTLHRRMQRKHSGCSQPCRRYGCK